MHGSLLVPMIQQKIARLLDGFLPPPTKNTLHPMITQLKDM